VSLTVRTATQVDLETVAALFDQYRQFYRQPADLERARRFIRQRFERDESTLLLAHLDDSRLGHCDIVGFTQLFPTFCSVAAGPILVLYDLFVVPSVRRRGVARALLQAAARHAQAARVVRVYESLGWIRDDVFLHYMLPIGI
jgi:ribosomal protein S18 acetylase RimI-like enzyme